MILKRNEFHYCFLTIQLMWVSNLYNNGNILSLILIKRSSNDAVLVLAAHEVEGNDVVADGAERGLASAGQAQQRGGRVHGEVS